MKTFTRMIGRYVLATAAVVLLVVGLLLGAVVYLGLHYGEAADSRVRIGTLAEALIPTADGLQLDPARTPADWLQGYAWAMVLDDDGSVIWQHDLPQNLNKHYTASEIASFSRWYLDDWPVFCWTADYGLFVAAMPRGSVWRCNIYNNAQLMNAMAAGMLPALALLLAVPLGLFTAVYLNEYAKPGKLVSTIEFATETLAGIPSIIFGLFGMMFFGQTIGFGYSILTGSLTLTLMVLPLITRNTQEALKTVPDSYRHGAVGLGAGKWHTIRTILLPSAMPGIITGVILAIGRIVGESAALLFTAGSAGMLPKVASGYFSKIMQSGGTLTIKLYLAATSEGKFDQAFGIAVVLLVIVFLINILTKVLAKKFQAK